MNRTTTVLVCGAMAIGAFGATALGDDGDDWTTPEGIQLSNTGQDDKDDRDGPGVPDRRSEQARDDDLVDIELRDDDEDDAGGGDTHSGGTNDGVADRSGSAGSAPTGGDSVQAAAPAPVAAPAPEAVPAPTPIYSDGSDYGDT